MYVDPAQVTKERIKLLLEESTQITNKSNPRIISLSRAISAALRNDQEMIESCGDAIIPLVRLIETCEPTFCFCQLLATFSLGMIMGVRLAEKIADESHLERLI